MARVIEINAGATVAEGRVRHERWRVELSSERRHEALDMVRAGDIYRCWPRRLSDVRAYVYPVDFERRVEHQGGGIHVHGQHVSFSEALGGMEDGIEPIGENRWRVWFRDLTVGGLESRNGRFKRCPAAAIPPPGINDCNRCPDNRV